MALVAAKVFATCLIIAITMQHSCGSAIPIWEFLTRNEKMSYLYSTFAQLVSVHCKATAASSKIPVNQCKHSLLGYGYDKLQTFTDAQLDTFDPYQRGASEIIWSNIMRDHPSHMLITTRKPFPTPPASAIIILTHQQAANKPSVPTPSSSSHHQIPAVDVTAPETSSSEQQKLHQFNKNPIFETSSEEKHQYAMDMDLAYGYPAQVDTINFNSQKQHEHNPASLQQQQTYLTGPLVFRVRPDGSPVEEDQHKPLPRDDDLEDYHVRTGGEVARNSNSNANLQHNTHRRIATISSLNPQNLATLALQQQLQPPMSSSHQRQLLRLRRQYQLHTPINGYFYGRGQA